MLDLPQPSPLLSFKQRIGLTDVEVTYSRPGIKGRKIFGELVPFDKMWRTGANATTQLTTSDAVSVEGQKLPAGTYGIYTIPGTSEWTVIFSKDTGMMRNYDAKNDVLRVKVKAQAIAEPVETFRIEFRDMADESATLVLEWDKTRVPVKFGVDVKQKSLAAIDAAMKEPKVEAITYFRASMFYLSHDQDVNRVLDWVEKGLKDPGNFGWLLLHAKAKALAKKGDKAAAIAAAKEAKEAAIKVEGPGGPFSLRNDEIIASLK